jgi:molecular chaperone GrpE
MSEPPPAGALGDAPGRDQKALTAETIETVLQDFRSWLVQAAADGTPPEDGGAGPEPPDLHTLLGQFIALRHEVNLQTRAVRAQQEQNAETLKQLSQAMQGLRQGPASSEAPGGSSGEAAVRPLLKALLDMHDVLSLAQREINRASSSLLPDLDRLASPPPQKSFWGRWIGGKGSGELMDRGGRQGAEHVREVLGSLLTGYTMSLQRLERALQQQGLEPIPTLGQPFDPEVMEVVEVVTDPARGGQVVEEVRRGYLWHGRVFRYAQVKVAKG